jgi:AcrR family transcriptional regulator
MSTKPNYHHGNLRQELLDTACDLLDREGIDAVTIRAVARGAGVAHSAPANHFKTRKDLLTALAAQTFEELAHTIQAKLIDGSSDPMLDRRGRLKQFASTILAFGLATPNRYRLLWRRDCLVVDDPQLLMQMDVLYEPLIALFSEQSQKSAISPETRGIALWSMIHGYVSLRLDGNLIALNDEKNGEPREFAIIDAFLGGIAAP